jgi:hypothetical protein
MGSSERAIGVIIPALSVRRDMSVIRDAFEKLEGPF